MQQLKFVVNCLDIQYLIFLCVSHAFLFTMDLRFDLIVIFLIFDVTSVPVTDNGPKKNSNKIQLNLGISNNYLLQQLNGNENRNAFQFLMLSSLHASNSIYNPFLNSNSLKFFQESDSNENKNSFHLLDSNSTYNSFLNSNNSLLNSVKNYSRVDVSSSSISPIDAFAPIDTLNRSVENSSFTMSNPVKTISERKCQEYVKEITGFTRTSLPTGPSSVELIKEFLDMVLVIGGTEARRGEFPHMVALGRFNSDKFILMCGGTLISHIWVLTAAHCTYGTNGGPTHAKIGFHSLTDEAGITVAVKHGIRHPDYNPSTFYADIALIQLMNAITFNTSIRPACLHQKYNIESRKAWVTGWGVTEFSGEVSNQLQVAHLDLIDNLLCTQQHNISQAIPSGIAPTMICAGDSNGKRDSCQGDSGGPLQIVHPDFKRFFQVIGITSFGQGCAVINVPGVYTRVSHYLSWIEKNVWPEEQYSGSSKQDSNKVRHNLDILNNPFLQPSKDNENGNPVLLNDFASQASDIVFPDNNYNYKYHYPIPNSNNNPFLQTNIASEVPDIIFPDYIYYYNTPTPSTPLPNIPIFTKPVPLDNDFTTSPTPTPPTTDPLISKVPYSQDLLPMRAMVSEQKCEEYVNEIVSNAPVTPSTGSFLDDLGACATTYSLITYGITVVGGVSARKGEFPHMVALGRLDSDKFNLMCGATLISHTWVLSAAHCTYGPNGGPTHTRIGIHNLTEDTGVTIAIKNMIRHPDYNPSTFYADIALIQLMNAVTFNESIRPACLFQQYNTVPKRASVSGWGNTEFSGEISNTLQKATVDIVDNLLCTTKYNSFTKVTDGMTLNIICAGDSRDWAKDTCQGDSGGPLQVIHPNNSCIYQVIGITSFGQGCATLDVPAIYTRVSNYLQWIEKNVWPEGS
ncbi:uncharacterized protein LOC105196043 [Solenopsis invicta]|uniref:uncharacterized protein LOC105196043 n=1 Tax=Solenopsis invicta TaxID=13686 RepID=UPI00193EA757|nr:uncharacterized protein LOC105196043 [Solenopsis invicta]